MAEASASISVTTEDPCKGRVFSPDRAELPQSLWTEWGLSLQRGTITGEAQRSPKPNTSAVQCLQGDAKWSQVQVVASLILRQAPNPLNSGLQCTRGDSAPSLEHFPLPCCCGCSTSLYHTCYPLAKSSTALLTTPNEHFQSLHLIRPCSQTGRQWDKKWFHRSWLYSP